MNRVIRKITYTLVAFLAAVIFIFSSVGGGIGMAYAATSTMEYSGVLDDLYKDESFRAFNYPVVEKDYSLQLIQIAESANAELFIYVYQPSGQAKKLKASSINISTNAEWDIDPDNYKLELLNSDGVFFKYKVNDFTVCNDSTRYYCITSIYRPFNKDLGDDEAGYGNTVTEVNYDVSKQYCFSTVDGSPSVEASDIETIKITDKFVGFVRYDAGFKLFEKGACDSHFVAFDTDKPIDKLMEAKVSYTYQSLKRGRSNFSGNYETFGDKFFDKAFLSYEDDEVVYVSGGGRLERVHRWDTIESTEQFISEVEADHVIYSGAIINVSVAKEIGAEAKAALKNTKWVLRFAVTDYSYFNNAVANTWVEDSVLIGDVTILRLKFETEGTVYNLGVIDNKQTGSSEPIAEEKHNFSLNSVGRLFSGILVILFLLFVILPVLFYLIEGIVSIIFLLIETIKNSKNKK